MEKLTLLVCLSYSSLSVYVHNCDDLHLEDQERESLDAFIDTLYDSMSNGEIYYKLLYLYQVVLHCKSICYMSGYKMNWIV